MDSKVKLSFYRIFCKRVEVKLYLQGAYDAGSRFIFNSWTYKELGGQRGRGREKECLLYDDKCGRISHVLWECPV